MAVTQIRLNKQAKDGSLTADAEGRAKMADNYVNAAKVLKSDTFDFATAGGTVRVSTPVAATDAANKSYVDNVALGLDVKMSVRAATTVNGALATAYENGDTIDGVTLATGNRILIKNQTTATENGIYTVNATGSPTRATDFATSYTVAGAFTFVEEGTINADSGWVCTNNQGADVVGTDSLSFTIFSSVSGALTNSNFVDKEIPTGAINGSNVTFTLAFTPSPTGSEHVYLNGVLQMSGAGNDYTISGATITYLAAPTTGDTLVVSYRK